MDIGPHRMIPTSSPTDRDGLLLVGLFMLLVATALAALFFK
jgi:hypothetical protein